MEVCKIRYKYVNRGVFRDHLEACVSSALQSSRFRPGCFALLPLIYPPTGFWSKARQAGLVRHFLFSAKIISMWKQKNRLTTTKVPNHFARIPTARSQAIEQVRASTTVYGWPAGDARGGREGIPKLAPG